MRKFSFPNRIIPLWNSLPDYVVSSPTQTTLNTFKARLDRFWENQEVRYNWKANILYTGSRSNIELMFWLLYSDCTIFGVIYNGLDIEVHDLRPAIYTTTTTTTTTTKPNPTQILTITLFEVTVQTSSTMPDQLIIQKTLFCWISIRSWVVELVCTVTWYQDFSFPRLFAPGNEKSWERKVHNSVTLPYLTV